MRLVCEDYKFEWSPEDTTPFRRARTLVATMVYEQMNILVRITGDRMEDVSHEYVRSGKVESPNCSEDGTATSWLSAMERKGHRAEMTITVVSDPEVGVIVTFVVRELGDSDVIVAAMSVSIKAEGLEEVVPAVPSVWDSYWLEIHGRMGFN